MLQIADTLDSADLAASTTSQRSGFWQAVDNINAFAYASDKAFLANFKNLAGTVLHPIQTAENIAGGIAMVAKNPTVISQALQNEYNAFLAADELQRAQMLGGLWGDAAAMAAGGTAIARMGELAGSVGFWRKEVSSFDPQTIRFSQESISYLRQRYGETYTFDDIINSMQNEGWKGRAIDIVQMPDGNLTSIDNTRVLAAKRVGIDVSANVRQYNEKLSDDMLGRFEHPTVSGVYAQTWGEAIEYRIIKQSFDFQNTYFPEGTFDEPRINYKK